MNSYLAGRVSTGHEVLTPGLVTVDDAGRVRNVEEGPGTGEGPVIDLGDVTLVPGLVDVHNHGGGGASFADDPEVARAAHLATGTTTVVASLVTQSLDVLEAQLCRLAPLVATGELAGIHLEGPWLAEAFKGAHPAERLRDPTESEVQRLLDAGGGAVRMVTIAVELPGALASVRLLTGQGVVTALGHSDCTYEQAREAIKAGVTGATHLFNAMPPLHHRSPGPVLALLADQRVWCELVADGVHLHPDLVAWVMGQLPGRVVLVTDAMAAAGQPDGDYKLGDLPVRVRGGVARIAGTDTIAGSTLTLATAVRNAINAGVPWPDAVRAATLNPARYLGLPGVGELVTGAWADAVAFDSDWRPVAVVKRGVLV